MLLEKRLAILQKWYSPLREVLFMCATPADGRYPLAHNEPTREMVPLKENGLAGPRRFQLFLPKRMESSY